jgi:hypothetical protein
MVVQEVVWPQCSRCSVRELNNVALPAAALEEVAVHAVSPNSLMMRAMRRPPAFSSRWRIMVVLPLPRKPVMTVAGIFWGIKGSVRTAEG